jgi:hypothetical protein
MAKSISEKKRESGYRSDKTAEPIKWWNEDDDNKAVGMLWQWVKKLRGRLATPIWMDLAYESFYTGRPMGYDNSYQIAYLRAGSPATAHFNVIRSIVETATSRLCKRRPMPVISALGARYSEQVFAKNMSSVLRTKMGGTNVEVQSPDVVRDAIINGNGWWKVERHRGDVHVHRVPMYELVYDPRGSYLGWPRQMAHVRPIDRDLLAARFPSMKREIGKAPAFTNQYPWLVYAYDVPIFTDQVELCEAWCLPTNEDDDGDHIISVQGHVLLREPWKRQRFPLAKTHWSPPMRGIRGQGLVEVLAGLQFKLNDIYRDIQEAAYHGGQLKVFVQRNSVNKHQLRARHPAVIEYDGAEPHYVPGEPVSQGNIMLVDRIEAKMYSLSGLNQQSAQGQNPLGPGASGTAIETLDDQQSDRFANVESNWQQSRVALGLAILDEAKAIHEEVCDDEVCGGRNEEAEWTKGDTAEWITANEWKRVKIDEGEYHLKLEPMNFLADVRGGKLQQVKDLAQAGLIADPTMTAELFDEPDLQSANRPLLGAIHNARRIIDGLGDTSVPMIDLMPDKYMNLGLVKYMVQGELEEAQSLKEDEEILERFRTWIEAAKPLVDAQANQASLAGAQAASMGAGPNVTQGGGGPPAAGPPGAPPMMPPGAA